jgi:hypothetical protein
MLHGSAFLIILVIYLAVVLFVLTMLWRIASALDRISRHLLDIAKEVKELSLRSSNERK